VRNVVLVCWESSAATSRVKHSPSTTITTPLSTTTTPPLNPPSPPPQADFRKAKEKVLYKKKEGVPEGLYM